MFVMHLYTHPEFCNMHQGYRAFNHTSALDFPRLSTPFSSRLLLGHTEWLTTWRRQFRRFSGVVDAGIPRKIALLMPQYLFTNRGVCSPVATLFLQAQVLLPLRRTEQ